MLREPYNPYPSPSRFISGGVNTLLTHCEIRHFASSRIDSYFSVAVNFDHFQILRAIGKGSFGKVRESFSSLITIGGWLRWGIRN